MITKMPDVLTSVAVELLFKECLFTEGEAVNDAVCIPVNGIMVNVGFHPGRIEERVERIEALLAELDPTFLDIVAGGKGGWSFLQLCNDRHDRLWGQHPDCERLMMLGLGIGKVSYLMPRDMWSALPGGMPYIVVNAERVAVKTMTIGELKGGKRPDTAGIPEPAIP